MVKRIVVIATALLWTTPVGASTITFSKASAVIFVSPLSFTSASITGTAIPLDSLIVENGGGPVTYELDGPITGLFSDTHARLEFFIDGCVTGNPPFNNMTCTPTTASYIEIVGSVPSLGVASQQLLVGNFIGGPADGGADSFFGSAFGGGADTKSLALLQALGLSTATPWQFSMVSGEWTVTNTNTPVAGTAVPEPGSLLLLGIGTSALAAYRRRLRR